jgi:hypothetical protein
MVRITGVLKPRLRPMNLSPIRLHQTICFCSPSLSGRACDYLPAHLYNSFSGTTISQYCGRQHLLAYIDGFPDAASTSACVFFKVYPL